MAEDPEGYTIEFHLSRAALAPAKMQPGTKLGLNFAIIDDGQPIEQFFSEKDNDGFRTPRAWGAVQRAPAP